MFYNIWQVGKSGNFFFQIFVSSLQRRMYKLYISSFSYPYPNLYLLLAMSLSLMKSGIRSYDMFIWPVRG